MKSVCTYFITAVIGLMTAFSAMAQSPTYHQGWTMLGESTSLLDVSYCVVECSPNSSEIHFQVFNENPNGQSANFTVTISDGGTSTTFTVSSLSLSGGEIAMPACGSNAYASLKTSVPSGYDPAQLSITISFN